MPWKIEFLPEAAKDLRKLDHAVAARILSTLETRIATLDDPRTLGRGLTADHAGYWRWQIGDYRVIGRIDDESVTVLFIRIAHRREVYR